MSLDSSHVRLALSLILPYVNRRLGRPAEVAAAVRHIHDAGGPAAYLEKAVEGQWILTSSIANAVHPTLRLALEMASHEDVEAAALRAELQDLEFAWRQAEELAAISDNFLMERETDIITKMKRDLTPVSRSS